MEKLSRNSLPEVKKRKKEWAKNNKAKVLASSRASYRRHKEAHLEKQREYRLKNKGRFSERDRKSKLLWSHKNHEKVLSQAREYRAKHPEKKRTEDKAYYLKTKESRKEIRNLQAKMNARRYLAENPEKVRKAHRDWYHKNKHRFQAYRQTKWRKIYGVRGHHTHKQWLARVEFYGWRCFYCKKELTRRTLTQDHRIPRSRGGSEWPSNLVPACGFCNYSKNDKLEKEWKPMYEQRPPRQEEEIFS